MKPAFDTSSVDMTTRQVAEKLGVSLRAIQLWVDSGVLDAWKTPGGHRRVSAKSVGRLLSEGKVRPHPVRARASEIRILVVEDDIELLRLYEMNMRGWKPSVELVFAQNGYEGLVRIGESKPDVLITDLKMPGIDGFLMIDALGKRQDLRAMRLIVVTGLTRDEIAARGGLPPNVTVFEKPARFDKLEESVRFANFKQADRQGAALHVNVNATQPVAAGKAGDAS